MEGGCLVGTGGGYSQYTTGRRRDAFHFSSSYPNLNWAQPYLVYEIRHAQGGMGTDLAFPFY